MASRAYVTHHRGRGRAPSPFRRALTIIGASKKGLPQQRRRTGLASFRVGFGPGGVLAPIARGVLARASSPAPTAKMAEGTPSAHRARKHGAAGGSAPRTWSRHHRCSYCRKLQEPLLCTTVECTGEKKKKERREERREEERRGKEKRRKKRRGERRAGESQGVTPYLRACHRQGHPPPREREREREEKKQTR